MTSFTPVGCQGLDGFRWHLVNDGPWDFTEIPLPWNVMAKMSHWVEKKKKKRKKDKERERSGRKVEYLAFLKLRFYFRFFCLFVSFEVM